MREFLSDPLYLGWLIILVVDGIIMGLLALAVTSKRYSRYRIRTPASYRIPFGRKVVTISFNMLLSVGFLLMVMTVFRDRLVHDGSAGGVLIFGEVLAALLFYDFMYFFMHRAMHHPRLMRYVHGVHHKVRYPTSPESIYVHPFENIAGLTLLMVAVMVMGPVSIASFLITFFIHSTANILVHSNLEFPHPAFKLFNFWAKKHDLHHGRYRNRNYASIFPFWDMMFGTYA